MMPPGLRALNLASRWFAPAIVHRTFEPLVADWQREWIDAPRSRRWIVGVQGAIAFCVAAVISAPAIARQRAPKTLTDQIAKRIAATAGIGTIVLMLPFLREAGPLWFRSVALLAVIPQALTIMFPFAMISAVDAIRGFDRLASYTARATVLKLAIVSCLFVFFCNGWVVPAANQIYREVSSRNSIEALGRGSAGSSGPARGVREMTNRELIVRLSTPTPLEPHFPNARMARREINNRASIALLPLLVLWRRWRALDLPAGRWFSANHWIPATLALTFGFFFLRFSDRYAEDAWHLPIGTAPWVTLVLLTAIGIGRVALARRTMSRASAAR